MKINFIKEENESLEKDEIVIKLQFSVQNENIQSFIDYINNYNENGVIVINDDDYTLLEIKYDDIIIFYSDKKFNYCKTKFNSYRIRSKLYELENKTTDFFRISKNCIVNMKHVDKFDISETGKIVIKLDDSTEQIVSRRKTKDIMKYLDNRRI